MVTDDKYHELASLLCSAQAGVAADYARFLKSITPFLRRMVMGRIPMNDVEDVMQDVLISVHKARHTYDGGRPIMPWLAAIARFRITDHLRKHYAAMQHMTSDISELENILADVTDGTTRNEAVDNLLHNVPEREKHILTLMHVQGYTARQVGEKLNMKESAVKVAAHRAVKKIRIMLGKYE
ncbi:MAG: sigma-70 family RNA polymerase sigma factor [Chitinophagia bacterium]|nr:sigma-70 family RNA polymerase sigma factor [Chitinophagia bacterium]